jgi:hypothetical protein
MQGGIMDNIKLTKSITDLLDYLDIKWIHYGYEKRANYGKMFGKEKEGYPHLTIFFKDGVTVFFEINVNDKKSLSTTRWHWYEYLQRNGFDFYEVKNYEFAHAIINYYKKGMKDNGNI